VITEEPPRLRDLPSERGDREILHLLDVGVQPPSAHVGVSPLRSDDDLRTIPGVEPSTEERLRIAVGSRDVHVPDARGERRIEDLPTPSLHRGSGALAPEVAIPPEIQVDGSPERGQAEPDPRGHEPGLSEGTDLHIGKLAPSEQGRSAPPAGPHDPSVRCGLRGLFGVVARAEPIHDDDRLVAEDPRVVSARQ
jgi:hypothetical protein